MSRRERIKRGVMRFRAQKGAALFLILIAVALFAVLSYAVTQMGRGSGDISREKARLLASEILQYGSAVRVTVQRMTLTGTAAKDIQFVTGVTNGGCPVALSDRTGTQCTTGANCVFAPEGGGMNPGHPSPEIGFDTTDYVGQYCYTGINEPAAGYSYGVAGVGADLAGSFPNATGSEAVFWAFDLNETVCRALNEILHIPDIPIDSSDDIYGDAIPGERAACVVQNGWYMYYQVLFES